MRALQILSRAVLTICSVLMLTAIVYDDLQRTINSLCVYLYGSPIVGLALLVLMITGIMRKSYSDCTEAFLYLVIWGHVLVLPWLTLLIIQDVVLTFGLFAIPVTYSALYAYVRFRDRSAGVTEDRSNP